MAKRPPVLKLKQRKPRFDLKRLDDNPFEASQRIMRAKKVTDEIDAAEKALKEQIEKSAATIERIGHQLAADGMVGFGGTLINEAEALRRTNND